MTPPLPGLSPLDPLAAATGESTAGLLRRLARIAVRALSRAGPPELRRAARLFVRWASRQLPAAAVLAAEVLVGLRGVRRPQRRSIPVEPLADPVGHVPQVVRLGQPA